MSPPATCKIRSSRRQSSLLFCGHQGVTQLLTTRQSDFYQEPARIAVAKRSIAENRVISGLERALGPARACQNSGARDLEDPCARCAPSLASVSTTKVMCGLVQLTVLTVASTVLRCSRSYAAF